MKHKKGFKALAAAVLSVSLLIGLVPATVFAATTAVTYVDENGKEETADCQPISSGTTTLNTGWYFVDDSTSNINSRITISGDVTLVLANQGPLTVKGGIEVPQNSSLTIYKAPGYAVGFLYVEGVTDGNAGIGGNSGKVNGTITINSAFILNSTGANGAAGIGTGKDATSGQPGKITINSIGFSAAINGPQGGAGIGPGSGNSVKGDISIFDSAMIKVGQDYADNLVFDSIACMENTKVEIKPCDRNHSSAENYRYEPCSSDQHMKLCDHCRTVLDTESHVFDDDGECTLCEYRRVSDSYQVTFIDGDETLDTVEVETGSTIPAERIPEVTVPDGKSFTGWKIKGTNDFFDIENDVVTGDITLVATFDETLLATIVESEVVFEGALKLAFGFHFTDELMALTGAKVVFKKGDEVVSSIALEDGYTRSNSDALFFDYGFMLPEFDEQITVWVVDADDQPILIRGAKSGTEYWEGVSYSAYEYADNSQNSPATSQIMKNLAGAFLSYGGAARTYFSAPETATAIYDYDSKLSELEKYKLTTKGTKPTGVTNVYINTFFEEDHTLRISFKLAEGKTKNDYTFQIDGENAKVYSLGDNKYAIEVNNIAAPNLADAHDFSISDGTATYTVKASALSYAYTSVKNGNTARKNLGVCMYDYFKKADEFFNENSQA